MTKMADEWAPGRGRSATRRAMSSVLNYDLVLHMRIAKPLLGERNAWRCRPSITRFSRW